MLGYVLSIQTSTELHNVSVYNVIYTLMHPLKFKIAIPRLL